MDKNSSSMFKRSETLISTRYRSSFVVSVLALFTLLFVACSGGGSTSGASVPGATPTSAPLKHVSIGLGYIPDIQFSPFYAAQSAGYYKAAGLDVTFNHGVVPDLFGSMVAGKNDFVFAGGDELLVARDKSVRAIDVATIFQKYPVSLIVPANSPIKMLADLKG